MYRSIRATVLALGALVLFSGCASNVPRAQYAVAPKTEHTLKATDSPEVKVAVASRDIELLDSDRSRIAEKISRQFQPQADADAARPYRVQVTVTRYEKGNAFARAMLAGLGQIHIDAEVKVFLNPGDEVVNQFTVEKTFAWGGIYGASTTILDVENPFAEAVANGLKGTTGTAVAASKPNADPSRSKSLAAGSLREKAMTAGN
ncbi:MAG: hypothetical protein K0Q76_1872 [Panacagrimonas sp.]|jgi:hypothetical protein|nr:DUF4410 domain-containing protein [Panacagrimonas sp.]MCC2656764.1 hypothetical protein [Panacagrimonas sp.]